MSSAARRTAVALTLWVLLLVVAWVWGQTLEPDSELKLGALPLYGRWDWAFTWRLIVPMTVGVAVVTVLPSLARQWPWRRLLAAVVVAVAGWSVALAVVDPGDTGFTDVHQAYGRHVDLVDERGGPAAYLAGYVQHQDSGPVHLRAHPPGLVLALWASRSIGLSGVGYGTALALAGVAVAAVAVLVIARDVAGERFARRAAPFVVLAPAAVWHTNADVVFGGLALAGVALVVLASGSRPRQASQPRSQENRPRQASQPRPQENQRGRWRWALAVAGGGVFGLALLLSYGVALLAVPIAVIVAWRRQWLVLAGSALAGACVVLLPLAWGFWWLDGLAATREQYYAGVGADRPYGYFLVANLAVFSLALGPATAAGLARLRDRPAWLVVGSGLAVVALADLSGLSSGETERIWQPFLPLVLLAGAAAGSRWWLVAQLAVAVVLQAALRSPW